MNVAYNSIPVHEQASRWSRAERPTTSCEYGTPCRCVGLVLPAFSGGMTKESTIEKGEAQEQGSEGGALRAFLLSAFGWRGRRGLIDFFLYDSAWIGLGSLRLKAVTIDPRTPVQFTWL